MNELDKIISLASEIEIAEKDADIITDPNELKYYWDVYLPSLYKELNNVYLKLLKKLFHTGKHSEYRFQYQLQPVKD
jgi:hypothetical protein